ncbi:cupin domain-containing protein [Azospirillum sp. sgz301742]
MLRASVILPAVSLAVALGWPAAMAAAADEHVVLQGDTLAWRPGPKALPPGAEVAVLAGNPEASGSFFVMRARLPDGYMVAPHMHSQVENVTVVSGTFKVGMGEAVDTAQIQSLSPGGFFSAPANMPHYAMMSGPTVIQISGVGPFDITYVNAKDDPRNMVGASQ